MKSHVGTLLALFVFAFTVAIPAHNLLAQSGDAKRTVPNSPEPFHPYFSDDFESGREGALLGRPYDAAGRSRLSNEQAHSGKQAARMEIRSGDGGGFGRWGAILPLQPALTKGQEVWVRLYVYWPRSFQFTASPWMKFFRLHTHAANGANHGYNDLYIDRADQSKSVLRTIKEQHDKWAVYDGEALPREQWECYEMYLSLDNVPSTH